MKTARVYSSSKTRNMKSKSKFDSLVDICYQGSHKYKHLILQWKREKKSHYINDDRQINHHNSNQLRLADAECCCCYFRYYQFETDWLSIELLKLSTHQIKRGNTQTGNHLNVFHISYTMSSECGESLAGNWKALRQFT